MILLIIKSNELTGSESFIHDHASKVKCESIIIHGKYPTVYGKDLSTTNVQVSRFLKKGLILFGKDKNLIYRFQVSRLVKKIKPDVILAEYGLTGVKLYSICQKLDIPLVVHFHGYDAHVTSIIKRNKHTYKKMLSSSKAVVAVSRKMRDVLIELGSEPSKTFVNPCGVNTSYFKKRTAYGKYFLSVGRFVEKKAPFITLIAFAKFHQNNPEFSLKMIGDGPLLSACKDIAVSLGIEESVEFMGAQPHHVVSENMSKAYAFLQHSIVAESGDSEGSPVAIAEAGASGIPVVSTLHAGIPDLVLHGKTGFLVKEKDAEAMAEAMIKLAQDGDFAEKMGSQAHEYVSRYYSQDVLIQRLEDILKWSAGFQKNPPTLLPDHIQHNHVVING